MRTLGHANIVSYEEFIRILIDRFDIKEPEIPFRELAQLKKTGTWEAYISEFEQTAVIFTYIYKAHLVFLFTEGLEELLCGLVKDYIIATPQDATSHTWDLQDVVTKTQFPLKTNFPSKFKDKKPLQKYWTRKNKMDSSTHDKIRRNKLCFNCGILRYPVISV